MFTLIVSVEEPAPDTVVGLRDAETCKGIPPMLNDTAPVNPWSADTVMVSWPEPPREIVRVAADALRAKSPAAVTTNVTFAECVSDAVLPVIVSVYVPTGVFAAVVTMSVDEPDPAMDVGTNAAVAADGNPLTDKFTVSANPLSALTETV